MSAYSLLRTFHIRVPLGPLRLVVDVIQPFHTFNSYGLFRVMTKTRPEIIVEGSNDGTTWKAYEFRYKPGDVRRRPQFVEPHQPRLDWQMWFAALSNFNRTPWFQNFLVRLLQGSPDVLDLLANNPFPNTPPKHVRALLYEYTFSDSEVRRKNGEWWQRTLLGAYSPVLTLK
jgi:lipase maturation factor 1